MWTIKSHNASKRVGEEEDGGKGLGMGLPRASRRRSGENKGYKTLIAEGLFRK
jgi:hypothetical protein